MGKGKLPMMTGDFDMSGAKLLWSGCRTDVHITDLLECGENEWEV